MPEMPEVDAVARRLRESVSGSLVKTLRILRPSLCRPQRPEDLEDAAKGRVLQTIQRRGKHLFFHFSGEVYFHAHLRMTGNIFSIPDARFHSISARAVFTLKDGRGIVFEDSRALGRMQLTTKDEIAALEKELGWEPLDPKFTHEQFLELARRSAKPSKIFLMDQQYVAGLGNIYVAEALFRAGIDPRKSLKNLKATRLHQLLTAIREVMKEAVESVYSTYAQPGTFAEGEIFPVKVYGREGEECFVCARLIRRIPQGGRSTYFCPGCQR